MKGVALASALVALLIAPSESRATVISASGAFTTAGPQTGNAPQCANSGPVSASCSYLGYPEYHYKPLQSTSSSFADLATGTLQVSAGTPDDGVGTANAQLRDIISLTLPANYSASFVPVTLSLSFAHVLLQDEASAGDGLRLGVNGFGQPIGSIDGFIGSGNNGAGNSLTISLTVNLALSNITDIPISAYLNASTGDNFGNGYAVIDPDLGITLPDGVTFTSGSGVLLSEVTAVPEPASLVLMGTGLLGFAIVRRRRRMYPAPM